jgi:hypothetical protein
MALIQRILSLFRRTPPPPPVIHTKWDPVPERWRRQAETNLRLDADKRAAVLAILTKEAGGDEEKGKAEFRRRYPLGGLE